MDTTHRTTDQAPQGADYSASIAKAIEWLGDRYLLAQPMKLAPSVETVKTKRMASVRRQLETSSYRQWIARSASGFAPQQ